MYITYIFLLDCIGQCSLNGTKLKAVDKIIVILFTALS